MMDDQTLLRGNQMEIYLPHCNQWQSSHTVLTQFLEQEPAKHCTTAYCILSSFATELARAECAQYKSDDTTGGGWETPTCTTCTLAVQNKAWKVLELCRSRSVTWQYLPAKPYFAFATSVERQWEMRTRHKSSQPTGYPAVSYPTVIYAIAGHMEEWSGIVA